jgi:hypothetical protein
MIFRPTVARTHSSGTVASAPCRSIPPWLPGSILPLIVVLAGCGHETPAKPAAESWSTQTATSPVRPTSRDTAGITLLTHGSGAFDSAMHLTAAADPLTVIGGPEMKPGYELLYVYDVGILSDGRVAALAQVGNKLLIFGADGKPQKSLGRQGSGPGDLMAPAGLVVLAGDTLLIPDDANMRINWVLPDKGFVADEPLPVPKDLPTHISPGDPMPLILKGVGGVLPDGRILLHSLGLSWGEGEPNKVARTLPAIAVVDLKAGSVHPIARIPDVELVQMETRYRGHARMQPIFPRFGRVASAVVCDSSVVTGSAEGYTVDFRNPSGAVYSRLTVPRARRPVTKAMRDAQIAIELARYEGVHTERMVDPAESKRIAREAPFADSLAPYSRFFCTSDRTLWVVDAIAPSDTGWSATAFRIDGAILGRLYVPGAGMPLAFANDRVVVRSEDADGNVYLKVYAIRKN